MANNKTSKPKEKGINPVAAGAVGAVVGAGIAAGATQALKNEKVKQNAEKIIDNVKDQVQEYLDKTNVDEKAKKTAEGLKHKVMDKKEPEKM